MSDAKELLKKVTPRSECSSLNIVHNPVGETFQLGGAVKKIFELKFIVSASEHSLPKTQGIETEPYVQTALHGGKKQVKK